MAKKIWARIGITLEVSDDYYEELKDRADKNGTCDLSESEAKIWMTEGKVNGDSYIPGEEFEEAVYGFVF